MKYGLLQMVGVALVSLVGCGDAGGGTAAPPGPVGTWTKSDAPTADVASAREVLSYNADGTFRSDKTSVFTATATGNPGCTVRIGGSGSYVVTGSSLAWRGATLGVGATGCMRPEDNRAYSEDPVMANGTRTFTLSGATLTLTGSDGVASVYTRQ